MGFWIFMFIANLLIPTSMIIIGLIWKKKAPKNINNLVGYRSKRSMKNKDTWIFAQEYIRKKWLHFGIILIVVVIIRMVSMLNHENDYIGTMSLIVIACEISVMAVSVGMTESVLKEHFDEDGNPINNA